MKKYLNNIFKMKKSVFVKNSDGYSILKISTNQRFSTYAEYAMVFERRDRV